MFTNGLGDRDSIPGWVLPKIQKMVLDATFLNTWHYKVQIKGSNPGNRIVPFPTHQCSSYWKGSFQVTSTKVANFTLIPDIGMMVRVFANGLGDLGSIPGRVIPKTQKMILDASLLNTQHYKVRIKGKVEQPRERSSALPYTLV